MITENLPRRMRNELTEKWLRELRRVKQNGFLVTTG
jgi:hypothetical protein